MTNENNQTQNFFYLRSQVNGHRIPASAEYSGPNCRVEGIGEKENLEIVDILIEKQTVKIPGRPVFNEMLKRIQSGEAEGILAWHPDRLARNSVDGGQIIYLLDTGIIKELKFPTFWFENTPQGKCMLSIAFGQSKYYIDNLSENINR